MQEEVTNKTVALIVDGAKLTDQTFEKAVKKFLEEMQKSKQPKIYRGKQTLKQLAGQNAGLANIEISDRNIRAFTQVAKKFHVDFALKKDTAAEQPRYLVFFKSRDADAITAAFQEFANRRMGREERPSIRERLKEAREQAAQKAEHRTIDREKVKDNPLRTAEMTLEDDYGMIDGVINNGRRDEEVEKAKEAAEKGGTEKKPSIRERLEDARRECSERKPPEKGRPGREAPEHSEL